MKVYDDCSPELENTLCLINDANESACGAGVCDGDGLFACDSERRPTYCDQGVLLRMQSCALGGLDCVAQNGPSGESGAGCGQGYSACTAHSCGEGAMSYCAPSGVHTEVPCTLLDPRLTSCAIVELNADDWGLDFSDSSSPGDSEDWMEADDDEEVPVCAASAEARECAEGDAFCDGDVAHVCVGGLDYAVDCGALEGAGCVQEAGKVSCEGLHTSSAAENTAGDAASPEPRFGADG